ncbi:hypothetical protein ABIE45_002314 [Methylobacterium sp. OAE515]|jgi:hypothetical protein|uniref:hypothetical protein n=1 Tax=Methylobacterium sp. OAE515 TaxID=2817895 RepID=UPI0017892391
MSIESARTHSVEIVPCVDDPRCYRWIIRARSGAVVEHSPYAFVTSNGARISGECWMREHFDEGRGG